MTTLASGVLVAIAVRAWNTRHPSRVAPPDAPLPARRLRIDIAATSIEGDAGGLMFAVGSVAIVLLGLPQLAWFFAAAVACALIVARMLLAWHATHVPPPVVSVRGLDRR